MEKENKRQKEKESGDERRLVLALKQGSSEGRSTATRMLKGDEGAHLLNVGAWANEALVAACEDPHASVVLNLLLAHPRLGTARLDVAFVMACDEENGDLLKILLADERFDPSSLDNKGIVRAASCGDCATVQLLLEDARTNPNAQSGRALQKASYYGHAHVVRCLAEDARVDVSAQDNKAVRLAAFRGHLEVVKVLLQAPAVDAGAFDNQAVRDAALRGHAAIVRRLLEEPSVDPSTNGQAALINAAGRGNLGVVQALIRDVRVNLGPGDEALRKALRSKRAAVAKVLIHKYKVDLADFSDELSICKVSSTCNIL